MTRKECFAALGLKEGAGPDEIKRAYRKLAFSLHPDLNPDVPDAAKRFQRVNEAYVLLSKPEQAGRSGPYRATRPSEEATARAREEAKKAYTKARQGQEYSHSASQQAKQPHDDDREDVLKDILNDPFARRVFEDIYSHIKEERNRSGAGRKNGSSASANGQTGTNGEKSAWTAAAPEFDVERNTRPDPLAPSGPNVVGKLKGWLRKQIDDEQVLRLPGESLIPGARVRLQIQHGLSGEPQVIELTLPPEFVPGKTMRLKGMGKRVGNWRGDLYVRREPV